MIRSLCKVHYSLKRHVESLCGIACIILAACEPADEENVEPLYAVDLGLSVKWAWCNVGAERPKEEGNRYAWGDTQPKVGYGSSKSDYAHYNSTMGTYKYLGTDISSTQYDAAHVEMGDDWRMPTKEEIQELKDKCTWEWKTLHENSYYLESDEDYDYHWQSGFLITGPNGNQIFLPEGGYWSGTLESYGVADPKSYMLSANDSSIEASLCYERNFIRPVKGKLNISDDESEKPTSSGGTYTANGVSFKMVGIGKGVFTMGATNEQSSSANSNERPTHQVVLSDYAIGETEVTQALWVAVMGSNPSAFTGNLQRPVEGVSWYECQNFIYKLNQLTGENFRLPTEAEWEYAARGGFNSGRYMYSGSDNLGQVGWYYSNSDFITHAVKSKLPNELGVYDMSGNVSEWCYDWYGGYSSAAQEDPTGPLQGTSRILRGGDYNSLYGDHCRVSYRSYLDPTLRSKGSIGLRLAKSNTTVGVPTGMEAFVLAGEILEVTNSKATISAEVCGTDRELTCGIIYGTTENLSATQGTMVTTTANGEYSVELTGLEPNTYYYYRAFVVVDGEYRYDQGHKFETMRGITIDGVSNITETGATISGVVETGQDVTCGIIYGTTEDLSATNGTMLTITAQGSYAIDLTGLDANTTYYYRAYAIVDGEYKYGEVRSFTAVSSSTVTSGDAIDLGLSVKWASCNVGADSPEEYGDYFAWGETTTKSSYTESNSITYGLSISELESRGIIDADGNLTAAYDAATANWGEDWRMPTFDEMKELLDRCTWEWTTQNGVNGYKVTGPNGNSIFLPAAGYRLDTSLNGAGSCGEYWSAEPYYWDSNNYCAYHFFFGSDCYDWFYINRCYGQVVRPVSEY